MKLFKTIFSSILLGAVIVSCNNNDDDIQSVEPKKIDSVQIEADTMTLYTMQPIKVFSSYRDGCEGFYGMDYIATDSVRTVVNYAFKTNEVCKSTSRTKFNLIRFEPKETGKYYFKFWNGKNQNDENIWIEKQIVVQ